MIAITMIAIAIVVIAIVIRIILTSALMPGPCPMILTTGVCVSMIQIIRIYVHIHAAADRTQW
jgi:hypothetical protein